MNYPLFLNYRSTIIGNGFVADVKAHGRLLATVEVDGVWLYGVNPGAIAADGDTIEAAHNELREDLRLTLVDFAKEAADFEAFEAEVNRFFNETDDHTVKQWDDAVQAIRATKAGLADLPKRDADTPLSIAVNRLAAEQLTAALNAPAMNQPMNVPQAPERLSPPALQATDIDLAQAA